MSGNADLQLLFNLVGTVQQFLERLVVQRQLAAISIVVALAWLLSYAVRRVIIRRLAGRLDKRRHRRRQQLLRYPVMIARCITFPVLALTGLSIVSRTFLVRGWHAGLVENFTFLFWIGFVYRLFVGIMYARIGTATMQRYRHRFLTPLFLTFNIGWLLNNLIPIKRLAQIQIWAGFTTPITLGALLIATLGFYFWYDGSGVVHDIIRAIIVPRTSAERGTLEASLKIGRYVIIAFGILIVLSVLGFDSTMLAFVTGGLSVGIGFGSQAIIGNLISGILLLFDQSLRPGDVVSVEGQMGVVKSLGIRATTVTTLNNVEIIVPNQILLTSTVTTYTGSDRVVRTIIPVETHNVSTPHEVREALLAAARQHPLVADEPAPTVFYEWAGDTSWLFKLAVWFDDPARTVPLTSELYFLIFEEFTRRGIEPSTPQRDLQIINEIPWDRLSMFSSTDRHVSVPIDRG